MRAVGERVARRTAEYLPFGNAISPRPGILRSRCRQLMDRSKYETQNIAFRHLESLQPGPHGAINALGELNVAAQPISRLATDDGDAQKAATPLSTTSLSIAGQVIEQESGLPLAGVMVKWTFSPTHTRAKNHRRNEIGSALTNDEGRFFIDAAASPEGKAALCGIAGEKRNGTTYLCLVDQALVLEIDRSGVAAELKQLFDVVLYLEYIASF
jgi:hypothetical protein